MKPFRPNHLLHRIHAMIAEHENVNS
jgi:DNA-binding response OmpR family regulator